MVFEEFPYRDARAIDYDRFVDRKTSDEDLWSTITEELEEEEPDLEEFEKPKPRPANEPDGFVLFDSKRDDLTQLDRYHEWQRR